LNLFGVFIKCQVCVLYDGCHHMSCPPKDVYFFYLSDLNSKRHFRILELYGQRRRLWLYPGDKNMGKQEHEKQ
jgi:hypothetical protein